MTALVMAGARPIASIRLTAVVAVAVISAGCGDRPPWPGDRLWESTHFRYHSWSDDQATCQGVTNELERHFALMQGYLGLPWGDGEKIDYFKFRDEAEFERAAGCPAGAMACTHRAGVRSWSVLNPHELIHAYLGAVGSPVPFFEEGAAVALSCERPRSAAPKPWRDVVTLRPFDDHKRIYADGAWFVGYLLERFGTQPFIAFYAALAGNASADEIAAAFQRTYALSLDEAWAEARDNGDAVRCRYLWECGAAPIVTDGRFVPIHQACDAHDQFPTVVLEQAGDVVVNRDRTVAGYAMVSCDGGSAVPVGGPELLLLPTLAHLPAGKYFVTTASDYRPEPGAIAVSAIPAPALSTSCAAVHPIDVDDALFPGGRFEISVPADGRAWYAMIRQPPGATLPPQLNATTPGLLVEQCSSCDDPDGCEELSAGAPGRVASGVDGVLTVRLTAAVAGSKNLNALFIK